MNHPYDPKKQGKRLRAIRNDKHLSGEEAAKKAGLPLAVLYRAEQGVRSLRDNELYALAQAYDVQLSYLLEEKPILQTNDDFRLLQDFNRLNESNKTILLGVMDLLLKQQHKEYEID